MFGFACAVIHCNDTKQMPAFSAAPPAPSVRWEYKTLALNASGHEKQGVNALASNEINFPESALNSLGAESWELVSSWLELETAFPNLGKPGYVTGLQPNVRPMRAVLLFKRPVK